MATYRAPSVVTPSMAQLEDIAKKQGLSITPEDLAQYREVMAGFLQGYNRLDDLAEPTLPVKYPRTPGYRPPPEENPYNAWYYKTDIKGAGSGPLAGKTIAIKDNVAVAGVPMMNGSKLVEGYIPEFDATIVTRILDAGGCIKGKAVAGNMCIGGSSSVTANGPVLNPVDKTRDASGSSSGSAALVAAEEVDMAIGGDQGGSIRVPAAWCGIVGLKPTWGLVPYTGACVLEPSVDHLGPMTRTVQGCAELLQVIAGYDDGLDSRQPRGFTVPNYAEQMAKGVKGLKVGLLQEGFESCEADVVEMVKAGANKLESVGALIEDVSVPCHKDGEVIYVAGVITGTYQTMLRNATCPVGLKGFHPTSMIDHIAKSVSTVANDMSSPLKLISMLGAYIDENYNTRHYAKSQNLVRTLCAGYDQALAKYDVLILPTVRFKAPVLQAADIPLGAYLFTSLNMFSNTSPFNSTGHPALSINAGTSEGLPVGMMIVGKQFDEGTVLRVARAFEGVRDS